MAYDWILNGIMTSANVTLMISANVTFMTSANANVIFEPNLGSFKHHINDSDGLKEKNG